MNNACAKIPCAMTTDGYCPACNPRPTILWPMNVRTVNFKFGVGVKVKKKTGFKFPGTVIGHGITSEGKLRYMVEADHPDFLGMLHIYSEEQLEPR